MSGPKAGEWASGVAAPPQRQIEVSHHTFWEGSHIPPGGPLRVEEDVR